MAENQEDLKDATIELAPGAGQPETEEAVEAPETPVEETEDVDKLPTWAQERLKKTEEEKENYRLSLLSKKKEWNKKLSLDDDVKNTEEIKSDYPDWDETSKKFQEQTLQEAKKIAMQEARQTLEKQNEEAAIEKFREEYPDDDWNEIVSNYNPKTSKTSVTAIYKGLKDARLQSRIHNGTIEMSEIEAFKRGEKIGQAKAAMNDLNMVSKTTSKVVPQGSALSKGALDLATKLRNDPKKVALEDDTLRAEIKF